MPKIDYAQPGHEAEGARPFYAAIQQKLGVVPNLVKLVGHSGAATEGLVTLLDIYFGKLSLPTRIRELAYLTATKSNRCGYCDAHHTPLAKGAGLTADQLASLTDLGEAAKLLSPAEISVVRFALETTQLVAASDGAHAALREHFDRTQIAEIAFVVASANFIQRIGRNFGAELEAKG